MVDYVDVDPEAVHYGGRTTAGTSTHWAQWATGLEDKLRHAASDSQEPVVTAAFQEHLSMWNPRMKGMAGNADALGTNAASAGNTVVNADYTSTTTLNAQGSLVHTNATNLHRPIST
jgi:hypothetical protein